MGSKDDQLNCSKITQPLRIWAGESEFSRILEPSYYYCRFRNYMQIIGHIWRKLPFSKCIRWMNYPEAEPKGKSLMKILSFISWQLLLFQMEKGENWLILHFHFEFHIYLSFLLIQFTPSICRNLLHTCCRIPPIVLYSENV